jgi:hypothetical protein
MQLLMQWPRPDELLSSVWMTTAKRTGLSIGHLTAAVLGRKTAPGFFQSGHLEQLAVLFGMDAEDLLRHHTVVPYAVAFYTEAAKQKALTAALQTGQAAVAMGAVTQSVSDYVEYRRWCPKCCLQEWRQFGQTYWHRSHNLPGVLVCVKHRVPLMQSQLPTTGRTSWQYILPQDDVGAKRVRSRCEYPLLQLANRSTALLAIGEHTRTVTPEEYRARLAKRGLLSPNREINAEKLKGLVRSVFRDDIEHLGLRDGGENLDWVPLMVRPGVNVGFTPLKHLLLQTALDLADSSQTVDHVPTGPGHRYGGEHDSKYAQELRLKVDEHLASGARVGVKDALVELGAWEQYRHGRERFPQLGAEVNRLRRSRAALRRLRRRMSSHG